jgi:hypothetical protein
MNILCYTQLTYTLPFYRQLHGSLGARLPVVCVINVLHEDVGVWSQWGLGILLRYTRKFGRRSLSYFSGLMSVEAGFGGQMVWHGQTIVLIPCR